MTTTRRRTRASVAAVLVLALGASACTGDDGGGGGPDGPPDGGDPPAAAAPVETVANIGRVSGGTLRTARKEQLKTEVKDVLDPWIDAAYVGGEWPRAGFDDAFRGFTAGARKDARRDLDLLSNADIGERVESVTATRRRVRLDVLAVGGRPVGVTARLDLAFRTTGEVARTETVRGRLFLTRGKAGWEVFGYDLSAGGTKDGKGSAR